VRCRFKFSAPRLLARQNNRIINQVIPPRTNSDHALDHNSFDALWPAGPDMETTAETLARLRAEIVRLTEVLKVEQDASTGKHANHVES